MNAVDSAAVGATTAYLFRKLLPDVSAEEVLAEIMSHFHPDDWNENGLKECRRVVWQLLTAGRDGPDKRIDGKE